MLLHRRKNAEAALHAPVVVVKDVVFNHADQFLFTGKALAIIAFPFEDAPKSFHRSVVDTLGYTGHTLRHTCFLQLVVEGTVGILKTSVAVEQWMCVGIRFYRTVKGLEYQRIVVAVTNHIGNDPAVVEVQNGAEIDLVYFNTLVPFELRYIRQPLFIWFICMEVAVKEIFGDVLWILCLPRTAMIAVFDGRLDVPGATDAENTLVIHADTIVMPEIIVDTAVTLVWTLPVDLFDCLCNLLILLRPGALFAGRPAMICGSRNMQQLAGFLNRSRFLCMAFLNGSI